MGLASFSFVGGSLKVFMIFPNFLGSHVLFPLATREASILLPLANREESSTYKIVSKNHVSFLLWRNNDLLDHQKVSRCYENDCRFIFTKIKV